MNEIVLQMLTFLIKNCLFLIGRNVRDFKHIWIHFELIKQTKFHNGGGMSVDIRTDIYYYANKI